MKIEVELTEYDLKRLVIDRLSATLNVSLEESDIIIETKSKQNYKSEWETAAFRARVVRT